MASTSDNEMDGLDNIREQLKQVRNSAALLTFVGSFCPVTTAHIRAIEAARALVEDRNEHEIVLAIVSVNSDGWVRQKFEPGNEIGYFGATTRRMLIDLAAHDLSFLATAENAWFAARQLIEEFPHLNIVRYELDGADTALRTFPWTRASDTSRYIVLGRPESTVGAGDGTEALRDFLRARHVVFDDPHGNFVLGPELPAISSSEVRAALARQDYARLADMLPARVLTWLEEGGHVSARSTVVVDAADAKTEQQTIFN